MPRGLLLSAAVLGLTACGQHAPVATNTSVATNSSTSVTTTSAQASGASTPPGAAAPITTSGASPDGTITVNITLTDAAAGQLSSLGQDLIVSADFYGMANAKGKKLADEMGQISLGDDERVNIPAAGAATLKVPAFDPSLLPDIDGNPQLLINVFSGVGMNPGNKLDCGIFQDDVAKAQAQPIQISCKAIGEP